MMSSIFQYEIAGKSHVGLKRTNNEDSLFFGQERPQLMIVADGMGGHAKGEVASKIAVEVPQQLFQKSREAYQEDYEAIVSDLVWQTNKQIKQEAHTDPTCRGMGSTIVLAVPHHKYCNVENGESYFVNKLTIAHVGDSRCYFLRDGLLKQLTVDHTVTGSLLSRALGHGSSTPDITTVDVLLNDVFLLCSDGLNKMVDDEAITSTLLNAKSCQHAVDVLVQRALNAGGTDNVSVIVARPQTATFGLI